MRVWILVSALLAACQSRPARVHEGLVLEPTGPSAVGLAGAVRATLTGGDAWDYDNVVQTQEGLTFLQHLHDGYVEHDPQDSVPGWLLFEADEQGTYGFTVETFNGVVHEATITFTEAADVRVDLSAYLPDGSLEPGPVHGMWGSGSVWGFDPPLVVVDEADMPLSGVYRPELVDPDVAPLWFQGDLRFRSSDAERAQVGALTIGERQYPLPEVIDRQVSEVESTWSLHHLEASDGLWLWLEDPEGHNVVTNEGVWRELMVHDAQWSPFEPVLNQRCTVLEVDPEGPSQDLWVCVGDACETIEVRATDQGPCPEPELDVDLLEFDERLCAVSTAGAAGGAGGWMGVLVLFVAARRRRGAAADRSPTPP